MCQGSSYPAMLTNKEHNLLEFVNVHLVFEMGGKSVREITKTQPRQDATWGLSFKPNAH